MFYGFLDIEMTCDGKQENGKFIDDGRMKHSQREIISVGFVVCDDKYNIKNSYSSFIKPVHSTKITDYCEKLTGITQSDVDHGKKCNNAFRDIRPKILKEIDCKNFKKSPSLSKIAEKLEVKTKGNHHNALNDARLLCKICRKLNIQID